MSGARDAILARLRAETGTPEGRAAQIEAWLREPRGGPLPALPPDPIETFVARAQTAAAQVRRVNGGTETVAALREILALSAGPSVLAATPDEHIQALPWPADLQVEHRNAGPADRVCLSAAYAGIAETGSLVLLSGPLTPTSMAFLPDHFVCLLRAEHIVPHPEDVLGSPRYGDWGPAPRRPPDHRSVAHHRRGADDAARRPRPAAADHPAVRGLTGQPGRDLEVAPTLPGGQSRDCRRGSPRRPVKTVEPVALGGAFGKHSVPHPAHPTRTGGANLRRDRP